MGIDRNFILQKVGMAVKEKSKEKIISDLKNEFPRVFSEGLDNVQKPRSGSNLKTT